MLNEEDLGEAIRAADDGTRPGYVRYLCELSLRNDPDDDLTLVRYAMQLVTLGLYDQANEALDRAEAVAEKKLLRYILAQRGNLLKAQGNFAAAEETFLKAHHLAPDDATYLVLAGSAAHRKGDVERAAALARRATQCSDGAIEEAYYNLGGCHLAFRQYAEAADCYRKALEIDREYTFAAERLRDVELILAHIADFAERQ